MRPSIPSAPPEVLALRGQVGAVIRAARERAGLSRVQLARRTGLSESTLKNVESGNHDASQTTLTALLAVPELQLEPEDLLRAGGGLVGRDRLSSNMNTFIEPEYSSMRLVSDLQRKLQLAGGTIDQSWLYLDAGSAQEWYLLCHQGEYAPLRELRDLGDLAALVRARVGGTRVDVLGLGCGDGEHEVRLVQHLLSGSPAPRVALYLLDISPPLLAQALLHARASLPSGFPVFALQGDFHQHPFYEEVLAPAVGAPRCRRLICLFGGTFGNLPNEVLFARNNLASAKPGDLLVLDLGRARASREEPDAVRRTDPHFSLPPGLAERERQWLTGPIDRSRGAGAPRPALEVESRFDTAICPVPGSYAIEKAVLIKDRDPPRRFVMTHVKRYEPQPLAQTLQDLGWTSIQMWDDGSNLLCLFERQ